MTVMPIASIETLEATKRADEAVLVEARLVWAGETIGVRHLRPRGKLRLRDLGLDAPGEPATVIADVDERGALGLRLPNGAAVPEGCCMKLRSGRVVLRLSLVADDVAAPPRARADGRVVRGIALAAALHLVGLGLVFAHARSDEDVSEASARETMQLMVHAAEARALAELAAVREAQPQPPSGGEAWDPAARVKMPRKLGLAGVRPPRGAKDRSAAHVAPRTARDEAATFGIVAILAGNAATTRAPVSAFRDEGGASARGDMFGQSIDDAAGPGGAVLSGAGEGGGGLGAGVPLGALAWSLRPGA